MVKIDIDNINKLKLDGIKKTVGAADMNATISIIISAYLKTLNEEEAKKLIESI